MIYNPVNPAPLQTFGSGRQQGSWPPVSHSLPKGDEKLPSAPGELEPIGNEQHFWSCSAARKDCEGFSLTERFRTIQRPAICLAWESCCWALSPLQHRESVAWPVQTSRKGEFKQAIPRLSARNGALSLLAFLIICSKMEAFNKVKHQHQKSKIRKDARRGIFCSG